MTDDARDGGLFPERLETDRLELERLCHDAVDVLDYYDLVSRRNPNVEAVIRYLPWDPHESPQETKEYLDELERKWADGERAEYLLRPRAGEDGAGEIAGSACLIVDWETRTGTPGIWLRKRFWGRGYSAERARALIAVAFERLDLDLVAVPVEDGNEKSRSAVADYVASLGGQYDGLVRNDARRPDGRIIDHHRYTVTREQYEGAAGE
ncbi:GNAT family N-acetyltransferase [Halomicrobium salinisoli]|uniref:GNAT family N-acetyltransferase n=1 Tax=Halomicrobium salinisoli TaxID=2878391 RepID=UPI001CF090AA|nr:GNAT family protein [Halomicrobium salinisoli]